MKRIAERLFSLLLALWLCVGAMPLTASAADGTEYRQTTLAYFSKVTNEYVTDSGYYSDDWFAGDSAERNDGLALISAQLSAAATDDPSHVKAALEGLGFAASAYDYGGEDPDKTAFTVGRKTLPDGRGLTAVVVQSDLYGERGWLQNVTVNREDAPKLLDHAAFSAAASRVLETLGTDDSGVFWFAGESRGGAIANLAAAYAVEAFGPGRVFAYTFESPATTADPDAHSGYEGIHNYVADDDPVTMLPLAGWGMTRYGTDYVYNSGITFEETMDALRILNPAAAAYYTEGDSANYNEAYAEDEKPAALAQIVEGLTGIVPDRAAYTVPNDDPQPQFHGYTYQEGLQTLCSFIFGGGSSAETLKGELAGNLSAFLDDEDGMNRIIGLLTELIYARLAEIRGSETASLEQASAHYGNLTSVVLDLAGTRAEYAAPRGVYALLRLLVPLLADPVLPAVEENLPSFEDYLRFSLDHFYDYDAEVPSRDLFNRLLRLVGCVPTLLFSHQPDVILARMKRLAPAPESDDLVLQIDEPKAGDAAGSVGAVSEAAEALGFSWIEVSDAVWRTEDATLQNDKAYYLDATLVLTGRSLPDSFSAKLNGREFEHRAVRYENGRIFVSGAWLFTFGEVPDTAAVHFDTGGICPAPADMEVPVNTAFGSLADAPYDPGLVKEEGACWTMRFDGWFDDEGTPWDELYTLGDMTVHAKWSMLIDEIEVTYEIPREGDTGSALFRLSAPEGVPFEIGERLLRSEDWEYSYYYDPEEPEAVVLEEGVERWVLGFWIHALSAEVDFLTEGEGYDSVYLGTLTVNGEPVDAEAILYNPSWYDEFEDIIVPPSVSVDFIFTLRGAADGPQVPEEPEEPGKPEASIPQPYLGLPFGFGGNGPFLTYDQLLALRELREKQDRPAAEPDRTPADDSPAGEKIDLTHEEPEECRDLPVFEDVPADAYFAPAAAWAADNGITTGTDGTHFSPDAFCTRAEAVTFLWRLAGSPVSGGFDLPFADIPEGAYYADAVLWASLAGIVRGTDPAHFSPDGIVTRAQCVTLLYRLMGGKQEGDSPFSDVPEDAWYRDAVLWAVSADVTRGKTEVLFAPEDACTRAQIVTFLYRASERS